MKLADFQGLLNMLTQKSLNIKVQKVASTSFESPSAISHSSQIAAIRIQRQDPALSSL